MRGLLGWPKETPCHHHKALPSIWSRNVLKVWAAGGHIGLLSLILFSVKNKVMGPGELLSEERELAYRVWKPQAHPQQYQKQPGCGGACWQPQYTGRPEVRARLHYMMLPWLVFLTVVG